MSIAAGGRGNVYVSELEQSRIRKIDGRTGRTPTLPGP
jgi:hypothetical protein